MTQPPGTAMAPIRAVVSALVAGGVRDVVICPGSRSTPMALALRSTPALRCWVHLDERSGAFFALGAARASRRPVAILATSGTAVVNFAPAVVEARYGRVPLLLLTADRPPESHGIGSPQTIDQTELFGRHAKWFAGLPVPSAEEDIVAESRSLAAHATEVARTAPAGPVQLNLPYREPLLPVGSGPAMVATMPVDEPPVVVAPSPADVDLVASAISQAERPLMACGPLDAPGLADVWGPLAAMTEMPILADPLSGLRSGVGDRRAVITHADLMLRSSRFSTEQQPDLIVRLGGTPTSKVLDAWLHRSTARQLLVDDGAGWERPAEPELVVADPVALGVSLTDTSEADGHASTSAWLPAWRAADDAAAASIDAWAEALEEPFEGDVARSLDRLPSGAVIVAGSSMPIRDLDAFMPTSGAQLRVIGNRGVNGIDGLISTALGVVAVSDGPVVAVIGDLAFLHDLNALAAAGRLDLSLTIVLVNNDGGGIFSFLPQATAELPDVGLPEHLEELFGTPHGLELGPVATALGARHATVGRGELAATLAAAADRPGLDVLELRTERRRNVQLHQDVVARVVDAVEATL